MGRPPGNVSKRVINTNNVLRAQWQSPQVSIPSYRGGSGQTGITSNAALQSYLIRYKTVVASNDAELAPPPTTSLESESSSTFDILDQVEGKIESTDVSSEKIEAVIVPPSSGAASIPILGIDEEPSGQTLAAATNEQTFDKRVEHPALTTVNGPTESKNEPVESKTELEAASIEAPCTELSLENESVAHVSSTVVESEKTIEPGARQGQDVSSSSVLAGAVHVDDQVVQATVIETVLARPTPARDSNASDAAKVADEPVVMDDATTSNSPEAAAESQTSSSVPAATEILQLDPVERVGQPDLTISMDASTTSTPHTTATEVMGSSGFPSELTTDAPSISSAEGVSKSADDVLMGGVTQQGEGLVASCTADLPQEVTEGAAGQSEEAVEATEVCREEEIVGSSRNLSSDATAPNPAASGVSDAATTVNEEAEQTTIEMSENTTSTPISTVDTVNTTGAATSMLGSIAASSNDLETILPSGPDRSTTAHSASEKLAQITSIEAPGDNARKEDDTQHNDEPSQPSSVTDTADTTDRASKDAGAGANGAISETSIETAAQDSLEPTASAIVPAISTADSDVSSQSSQDVDDEAERPSQGDTSIPHSEEKHVSFDPNMIEPRVTVRKKKKKDKSAGSGGTGGSSSSSSKSSKNRKKKLAALASASSLELTSDTSMPSLTPAELGVDDDDDDPVVEGVSEIGIESHVELQGESNEQETVDSNDSSLSSVAKHAADDVNHTIHIGSTEIETADESRGILEHDSQSSSTKPTVRLESAAEVIPDVMKPSVAHMPAEKERTPVSIPKVEEAPPAEMLAAATETLEPLIKKSEEGAVLVPILTSAKHPDTELPSISTLVDENILPSQPPVGVVSEEEQSEKLPESANTYESSPASREETSSIVSSSTQEAETAAVEHSITDRDADPMSAADVVSDEASTHDSRQPNPELSAPTNDTASPSEPSLIEALAPDLASSETVPDIFQDELASVTNQVTKPGETHTTPSTSETTSPVQNAIPSSDDSPEGQSSIEIGAAPDLMSQESSSQGSILAVDANTVTDTKEIEPSGSVIEICSEDARSAATDLGEEESQAESTLAPSIILSTTANKVEIREDENHASDICLVMDQREDSSSTILKPPATVIPSTAEREVTKEIITTADQQENVDRIDKEKSETEECKQAEPPLIASELITDITPNVTDLQHSDKPARDAASIEASALPEVQNNSNEFDKEGQHSKDHVLPEDELPSAIEPQIPSAVVDAGHPAEEESDMGAANDAGPDQSDEIALGRAPPEIDLTDSVNSSTKSDEGGIRHESLTVAKQYEEPRNHAEQDDAGENDIDTSIDSHSVQDTPTADVGLVPEEDRAEANSLDRVEKSEEISHSAAGTNTDSNPIAQESMENSSANDSARSPSEPKAEVCETIDEPIMIVTGTDIDDDLTRESNDMVEVVNPIQTCTNPESEELSTKSSSKTEPSEPLIHEPDRVVDLESGDRDDSTVMDSDRVKPSPGARVVETSTPLDMSGSTEEAMVIPISSECVSESTSQPKKTEGDVVDMHQIVPVRVDSGLGSGPNDKELVSEEPPDPKQVMQNVAIGRLEPNLDEQPLSHDETEHNVLASLSPMIAAEALPSGKRAGEITADPTPNPEATHENAVDQSQASVEEDKIAPPSERQDVSERTAKSSPGATEDAAAEVQNDQNDPASHTADKEQPAINSNVLDSDTQSRLINSGKDVSEDADDKHKRIEAVPSHTSEAAVHIIETSDPDLTQRSKCQEVDGDKRELSQAVNVKETLPSDELGLPDLGNPAGDRAQVKSGQDSTDLQRSCNESRTEPYAPGLDAGISDAPLDATSIHPVNEESAPATEVPDAEPEHPSTAGEAKQSAILIPREVGQNDKEIDGSSESQVPPIEAPHDVEAIYINQVETAGNGSAIQPVEPESASVEQSDAAKDSISREDHARTVAQMSDAPILVVPRVTADVLEVATTSTHDMHAQINNDITPSERDKTSSRTHRPDAERVRRRHRSYEISSDKNRPSEKGGGRSVREGGREGERSQHKYRSAMSREVEGEHHRRRESQRVKDGDCDRGEEKGRREASTREPGRRTRERDVRRVQKEPESKSAASKPTRSSQRDDAGKTASKSSGDHDARHRKRREAVAAYEREPQTLYQARGVPVEKNRDTSERVPQTAASNAPPYPNATLPSTARGVTNEEPSAIGNSKGAMGAESGKGVDREKGRDRERDRDGQRRSERKPHRHRSEREGVERGTGGRNGREPGRNSREAGKEEKPAKKGGFFSSLFKGFS